MRSAARTVKALGAVAMCALFAAGCGSLTPRAPMSDGERLYVDKCTSCHDAYEPHDYSPTEWKESIAEMERRKRITLTDGERRLILSYLVGPSTLASR